MDPGPTTMHLETKYLLQDLLNTGLTTTMCVDAVQELKSGLVAADAPNPPEVQLDMARKAIRKFQTTKFGDKSFDWILERGYAIAPLFSPGEVHEKTRTLTGAIEKAYLRENQDGELEVSPATKRLSRIQSQKRWMIDLSDKVHVSKVGDTFMSDANEAAEAMAAALRAVHYGYDRRVDVEKLTLLLSPAGEANQILHRDQSGPDTRKKLAGSGRQPGGLPPPYSAICAFRDPVYLHVIDGSHKDFSKDQFDWSAAVEVVVPPGYGILFHGCLVHGGGSYGKMNGRLHVYLRCSGDTQTANGKVSVVSAKGAPPDPKIPN